MTPIETAILKANRKIQIMEEIHILQMELFELQCDDILLDHRALTDFICSDPLSDLLIDQSEEEEPKSPNKKRKQRKPKRKDSVTRSIRRSLFDDKPFGSIYVP